MIYKLTIDGEERAQSKYINDLSYIVAAYTGEPHLPIVREFYENGRVERNKGTVKLEYINEPEQKGHPDKPLSTTGHEAPADGVPTCDKDCMTELADKQVKKTKQTQHAEVCFPLGTQFTLRRGKNVTKQATVIDWLHTYNTNDELVKMRYVVQYDGPLGQKMTDRDICHTTIKMAQARDTENKGI